MPQPLQGVKVLDLTRVLAGPYCTMILGDLGADIMKVELPGGSDDTRFWGPPYQKDISAYYMCTNRNKRSLTLNLKTAQGIDILKKLVRDSDVIIHNFKNGTMEKWGIPYEQLKKINPRLIYAAITGFGATGPLKDLAGYDSMIQAMSGLMSITGSEESGPLKVGVAITDIITGLYAGIGIEAALYERESSGKGQTLDLALFDSAVSALANVASNYLVSGHVPQLLGNQHPNIVPYQTFATKDGEMVIAVGNDRQFRTFCELISLPDLAEDERFQSNAGRITYRDELVDIIANVVQTKTSAAWLTLLGENGIPCGPIHNVQSLFEEPHIESRDMLIEMLHPRAGSLHLVGSPLRLSRTPVNYDRHPPDAGEHTQEILTELGYSADEYRMFKHNNII
jgi:crotonobetainyl-CoA:carnitine CoA-transferase CaiB-like acyl-CoA transferase